MAGSTLPPSDDPTVRKFLTPEEVRRVIRVSRSKIYELLDSGEIPWVPFGKLKRIPGLWLRMLLADSDAVARAAFERRTGDAEQK